MKLKRVQPVAPVVFVGLLIGSHSLAQPGAKPEPPKPQPLTLMGRIHSFNAEQINVVSAENQPWQVTLNKNTHTMLKGVVGQEGLRPRTPVRFHAWVNKRGQATEPVAELTLFSPHEGFAPLVEPAPEEEGSEEEDGETETAKETLAADEDSEAEDTGQGETEQQESDEQEPPRSLRRRARTTDKSVDAQRFFVTGLLMSVKRGKFVVNVGDLGMVKGELADEAVVNVEFTNHAGARPGDEITVEGRFTTPGLLTATKVEITLAAPVETQKSKRKRAKEGRNKKEPDEAAGAKKTSGEKDTGADDEPAEVGFGDR